LNGEKTLREFYGTENAVKLPVSQLVALLQKVLAPRSQPRFQPIKQTFKNPFVDFVSFVVKKFFSGLEEMTGGMPA
jgi:hypothetical protein